MANVFHNNHKSALFWQILFPLLLSLIIISSLGFFIFSNQNGNTKNLRLWADISFMLITLSILDLLLILLLSVIFSVFGVAKLGSLTHKKRKYFKKLILKVLKILTNLANIISKPFFAIAHITRITEAMIFRGNSHE